MIRKLANPRLRFNRAPEEGAGAAEVTPAGDPAPEETPAAEEEPAPDPEPEPETPAEDEGAENVDELPSWAQAEIRRLRNEAAQRRTAARELEQKLEGALSAEEAATLRTATAKLERDLLATRVAHKHQLPDELASLLQGETEDELKAHAKKLAAFVTPAPRRDPSGGLDPTDEDEQFDPVAEARKARARRY